MRTCRPKPQSSVGMGRGTSKLIGLLNDLNLEGTESVISPELLGKIGASTLAQPVTSTNMSLRSNSGLVYPENLLTPDRAAAFLNFNERLKPVQPMGCELPKPCYCVARNDEHAFRSELYNRGIAVPIPESTVAKTPDGELLLSGAFGVTHSSGLLRFIFDMCGWIFIYVHWF